MAERSNYELHELTPEEQEQFDGVWPEIYARLAYEEERELPNSDTSGVLPKPSAAEGITHTASIVAKQLGSAALFPGRAYWNVLKWGYRHVR